MNEAGIHEPVDSGTPPISVEPQERAISGFWRRSVAFIVDVLLLSVVGIILGMFYFDLFAQLGGWGRLVGFVLSLAYFGTLNSAIGRGQTIGKRLMEIEVVDRSGKHISLPRSLLRYSVLGVPYFLNGAMLPPNVLLSFSGYVIAFLVFGLGGATLYLFVFNRHTRQTVHDLATGTFVVKRSPRGEVAGSVWRFHLAVVGAWFVVVIVLSVILVNIGQKGLFPEIVKTQQAILNSDKVHGASVFVGKTWDLLGSSGTTYIACTAVWHENPQDWEAAARYTASIIMENYPEFIEKDVMTVVITYGFDIGIAKRWRTHNFNRRPEEWKNLLNEKGVP